MASITPKNGRAAWLTTYSGVHTYWELNSTNLGTNYGDDSLGGDNTSVGAGDISTQESYDGCNAQNDPPASDAFDIYIVTDCFMLLYIPAGITHNQVTGIFHNGGGTHAQGMTLRGTSTGVEIGLTHNQGGSNQDALVHEIPDADLPGWFCVSGQFCSEGGAQGDMGLWINGVKERSGTRGTQLAYGSGNPDFGNFAGDPILAANVLDPASYSGGNWSGSEVPISTSGVLIANFAVDNPNNDNTSPAGLGDAAHEDYYTEHVVTAGAIVSRTLSESMDISDNSSPDVPSAFRMALSTHFVDGAATTAQLTAPSGKTSGADFLAGKIVETSNPVPTINLGADEYTEIEWSLESINDVNTHEATYEFRVVENDGTVLDTYTVTPELTLSSASGVVISRVLSEQIDLDDNSQDDLELHKLVLDTINLSDTQMVSLTLARLLTTSIALESAILRSKYIMVELGDTFGLTDELKRQAFLNKFLTEQFGVSDDAILYRLTMKILASGIDIQDFVARSILLRRVLTEQTDFEDSLAASVAMIMSALLVENLSIQDAIIAQHKLTKLLSDNAELNDNVITSFMLTKLLQDSIATTDIIQSIFIGIEIIGRVLSENVGLLDEFKISYLRQRIENDLIDISEDISHSVIYYRELGDVTELFDEVMSQVAQIVQLNVNLTDSLGITDDLETQRALARQLTVGIFVTTDMLKEVNVYRALTEVFDIVDEALIERLLLRIVGDAVEFDDELMAILVKPISGLIKVVALMVDTVVDIALVAGQHIIIGLDNTLEIDVSMIKPVNVNDLNTDINPEVGIE